MENQPKIPSTDHNKISDALALCRTEEIRSTFHSNMIQNKTYRSSKINNWHIHLFTNHDLQIMIPMVNIFNRNEDWNKTGNFFLILSWSYSWCFHEVLAVNIYELIFVSRKRVEVKVTDGKFKSMVH